MRKAVIYIFSFFIFCGFLVAYFWLWLLTPVFCFVFGVATLFGNTPTIRSETNKIYLLVLFFPIALLIMIFYFWSIFVDTMCVFNKITTRKIDEIFPGSVGNAIRKIYLGSNQY